MWQPIETCPNDGLFLVYGGEWHGELSEPTPNDVALVHHDSGQFTELGGDHYLSWIINPTHWMPLPDPPKPK